MKDDPYRRVARFYDRLFEPLNRDLRLIGLKMFPPEKGMRILDVGCGTGVHLDLYRRCGCRLYGVDASASMLHVARARLGNAAGLHLASAATLPYAAGSFDLVIAMLALHEMAPSERSGALSEMKRVLRTDGRMLLIDFHPGRVHSAQGGLTKAIIFLSELAAGRRHFRHYRQFMSIKGLPTLAAEHDLTTEANKVVAGGMFGLFLLSQA